MKKGKVWGTTESLLSLAHLEIHRIHIEPGGYCSWHRHDHKWNAFIVTNGCLTVETEDGVAAGLEMNRDDITTVAPGVKHRFINKTLGGVDAFEVYYPRELSEDIIRETIGGVS